MAFELDSRVQDELRAKYHAMEEKGDLFSREQLAKYYSTFRAHFGPNRLKTLSDEDLLEVMHAHGKRDSLVYWLEFKNDEEFPTSQFGGIAGGSAHKYGLFYKKATSKWLTGSPQNEQELTLEQAIEKAKQHREELLKGIELLENLPANSTDEDYERLQQEMNRVAPDISNRAWGHKYFALLYPEKLDEFHTLDRQRFNLMNLQQPSPLKEGRYAAASCFVSVTRHLGIPMNNLTAILNVLYGKTSYSYGGAGIQLQREIQEGLITLLVHAALPENREQPYTVITTSPSQWLPYCSSDRITIVDVSGLIGPTQWRLKADAKDYLIEELQASGWSELQILSEAQLSALTHRFDGSQASKIRDRIDLVLTGDNRSPIAVVALQRYDIPSEAVIKELRYTAQRLDLPFALVTDGRQTNFIDVLSGTTQTLATFPSPQDLGLDSAVASNEGQSTGNTGPTIIRCDTSHAFVEALSQTEKVTTIIDYTLPWGDGQTEKALQLQTLLPESLQMMKQPDSFVTLLLLAVARDLIRRLVCLVPQVFAYSSAFAQVRSYLATSMSLTGVIELPSDLFSAVRIPSSLLVLTAPQMLQKTAFLSLPNRGDMVQIERQSWFSDLIVGLQGKPMQLGFLTQVSIAETWAMGQHRPELRATEERIKQLAPTSTLGELCDIILGSALIRKRATGGKDLPVIQGKDIAHLQTKKELETIKIDTYTLGHATVRQGDILLQRIGTPQTVKAIVVHADLEGAVASDTLIILRPKDPSNISSAYIKQFLQSIAGRNLLAMRTSGTAMISLHALKTIPIPVLSPNTSFDLDELQKLENELRLRADKMESMRLGLFNAESLGDFRNQLGALRQTAQAVAASIQQAESVDFQIRNFYPYPLVFPYRTLASLIHPRDQYSEQLRIAENILAFLGSLTLALIPPEAFKLSGFALKGYWQGGISPGHWLEICRKGADLFPKDGDNHLTQALLTLLKAKKQKQFRDKLDELVRLKNDLKHDRGPKVEEEFQDAALHASNLLKDVMYALSFLTEYPLHLVRDVDLIRGTRRVILKTLRYAGDHPGLPVESCEYAEPLKKGDLYIQLEASRWLSLFPFITVYNCSSCKSHETYFVDHWKDQKAILKSFERGHAQESHEVAIELSGY